MKYLTLFIALILFAGVSHAQSEPDSQIFVAPGTVYTNQAAAVNQHLKKESFEKLNKMEVNQVLVSLVHYSYMEPDQFGILMKLADSTSGCFDLSPLEYEANFIEGNYMDIKVKEYRREITKTKNPEFDCDQKTKIVSGLIVISAEDLKRRGVREIRFDNGKVRDAYVVTINDDSITLEPDSMIAFKAQGLTGPDKDRLTYYFSGNAIVAVHVPMAKNDDDIAQAVRNLAYKSALQPVSDPKGIETSNSDNIFYFMDPTGRNLDRLGENGYAELGTIQALRPFDGPKGRQGLPTPLKVFVTRPGTTL